LQKIHYNINTLLERHRMNIDQNIYQKHCNCEIAVDWNYIPKKHRKDIRNNADLGRILRNVLTHTPPALICVTHQGRWLKWMSVHEAQQIETELKASV